MCAYCETDELKRISHKGIVCEKDQQQKDYEEILKLWVDNKISYETLMKAYPDYDAPMWEKIYKKIKNILSNDK